MIRMKTGFDLAQFTISSTAARRGIDNTPTPETINNLRRLHAEILLPIRTLAQRDLIITSGYRSPELNKAIGGAKNSAHMEGKAADFYAEGMTIETLYEIIKNSTLVTDQTINEFQQWIHVAWADTPRKQFLRATKKGKRTIYIVDKK